MSNGFEAYDVIRPISVISLLEPLELAEQLAKHVATTPPDTFGMVAIDTLTVAEWFVIINALRSTAAHLTPAPAVAGRSETATSALLPNHQDSARPPRAGRGRAGQSASARRIRRPARPRKSR